MAQRLKRGLPLVLALVAALPAANATAASAPGELVVSFSEHVPAAVARARVETLGARVVRRLSIINGFHVRASSRVRLALADARGVRHVSTNRLLSPLGGGGAIPDDPLFGRQWTLRNTGQGGGTPDADIDAPEAWELSRGEGTVVAIVDEGVDVNHPDLRPNIWTNAGELPGNGLDDDGNGYADDVHGWNFLHDSNDPAVSPLHGTWVAGLVAARADDGVGIAGAAPRAQLMPLKFFGDTSLGDFALGTSARAIEAIGYATDNGADVINNSWGYRAPVTFGDPNIWLAVGEAVERGVTVVFAGGNDAAVPYWPQGLPAEGVIVATGSSRRDELCPTTYLETGDGEVGLGALQPNPLINDLAAPACRLPTTASGGRWEDMVSGTSFAAPHVSAAAALLLARHRDLEPTEVKCLLKRSVDHPLGLAAVSSSMGRLNMRAALELSDTPDAPLSCLPDP